MYLGHDLDLSRSRDVIGLLFAYSIYNFYGALMTIKGRYQTEIL